MLTLAAAQKGFRVVAVDDDEELISVLDSLARIMRLRARIELRVCDALTYSRRKEGQIMANPPFTRHHSIPMWKKRALAKLASKLEAPLQSTTGYHGYFMAYAWGAKWSKHDVFLLPTNWLEAKYGQALRQMLLARSYEISIVENGYHSPVFDHALTTICLLVSRPGHLNGTGRERVTPVSILKGAGGGGAEKSVSEDILAIRLYEKLSNQVGFENRPNHVLGDMFNVKRGIATGHNEFFVLSKASARKLGLGRAELVEVLRRLEVGSPSMDVAYLWVPADSPSAASKRRIEEGEQMGVNRRYLCEHRNPWWRIQRRLPPAYFLTYMGRGRPRIVENKDSVLNLNNTHGLYVRNGVPVDLARRVIEWLGSQEGVETIAKQARHYYGGMWKLEPRDVERAGLPSNLFSNWSD
jgi:hypothetical protein